jgi:hypothetical protein
VPSVSVADNALIAVVSVDRILAVVTSFAWLRVINRNRKRVLFDVEDVSSPSIVKPSLTLYENGSYKLKKSCILE